MHIYERSRIMFVSSISFEFQKSLVQIDTVSLERAEANNFFYWFASTTEADQRPGDGLVRPVVSIVAVRPSTITSHRKIPVGGSMPRPYPLRTILDQCWILVGRSRGL